VVGNTGWLPTYVTQRALDRQLCPGVTATLQLPPAARVLDGDGTADLGQLEGRSEARTTTTWWGHRPGTPDLGVTRWLVEAPPGSMVSVRASHPRAGVTRAELRLE
jgi:hypothetical protein